MPKTQITQAQISRALKAARKAGETVYGYAVEGASIVVHTRPLTPVSATVDENLDKWFEDDDD